jgi:hypothetical protein
VDGADAIARGLVGSALIAAESLAVSDPQGARALAGAVNTASFDGFTIGCMVAAGVALAGALFAARFLPARPADTDGPAELTGGGAVHSTDASRDPGLPVVLGVSRSSPMPSAKRGRRRSARRPRRAGACSMSRVGLSPP